MARRNGGLIGPSRLPTTTAASGVWSIEEAQTSQAAGIWPSTAYSDQYFKNVNFLLNTNAQTSTRVSTTGVDSSASPKTITRAGSISTGWAGPYWPAGYWSWSFGTGAYITHSGFTVGNGAFTVEFWFNLDDLTFTNPKAVIGTDNASGISIQIVSATQVTVVLLGVSSQTFTIPALSTRTWYHLAVVRSGGNISVFVNGTRSSTGALSNSLFYAASTFIGTLNSSSVYAFGGSLSNVSVLVGTAKYDPTLTSLTVPASPLPRNTVNQQLLVCAGWGLFDSNTATTDKTLTIAGTPQVSSWRYPSGFTAPSTDASAGFFNGSTDYLSVASNAALALGTGDFTIEMWFYYQSSNSRLITWPSLGPTIYISSNVLYFENAGTGTIIAFFIDSTIPTYCWFHLAVCRASSSMKIFINGVQGSYVTPDSTNWGQNGVNIGVDVSTNYMNGYIADLRVVKGIAVYTGNFTPPTAPLTQTGGTYPSTTNVNTNIPAASTILLVNFASSNFTSVTTAAQNNTFIDSSSYALAVTRNVSATQGAFNPYQPNGYWSNYFDGSSPISVSSSAINPTAVVIQSIEFWIFANSYAGTAVIYECGAGNITGDLLISHQSGNLIFGTVGAATASTALTAGIWNYVVCVRNGPTYTIFVNGPLVTGPIVGVVPNSRSLAYIGSRNGSLGFTGYLSNFRVSNASINAVDYASVPTLPLTAAASTVLLTCQSNRLLDNSSNAITLSTPYGNASTQTFQPYTLPIGYNTALYGGSAYFNATTVDYLSIADNPVVRFGSSNFTLEGWFYRTGGINADNIFFWNGNSNSSSYSAVRVQLQGSGVIVFLVSETGSNWKINITTSAATYLNNVWNHIAVVRVGGTVTLYLNGTAVTSGALTTSTTALYAGTINYINNMAYASVNYTLTGYVSNVRLVIGTAVYTGNFASPRLQPLTAAGLTSAASYPSTTNVDTSFGSNNTILLLNFTNAGIVNAAPQSNPITISTAQTSSSIYKYSPGSIRFNGSTDYLYIPGNTVLNFTSANWTVEAWVYLSALPTSDAWPASYSQLMVLVGVGSPTLADGMCCLIGQTRLSIQSSDVQYSGDTHGLTINTWNYLAYVRNGTSIYFYVNNILRGSAAFSGSIGTGSGTYVGCETGEGAFLNGYIQDLRITKGVARAFSVAIDLTQSRTR